jgi:hypothetical protein
MGQIQEQRLVEGPAPGGQRLQEIIDRQAAGVAAIGGDPNLPLPNATATLAGINSGGAPSGSIRIVPPGAAVVPLEEAAVIPEMQLETDVADEETPAEVTAVAPETVAASETSVSATPTEVQPLTVEETNEYNGIVDFLDGASASDMLEEEQLDRFKELAGRVSELERAGFDFDETTGWTKPGAAATPAVAKTPAVAETPAAPQEPTPFKAAPDFRYTITEVPNYGLSPLLYEDADFELEVLEAQAEKGRLTPERFAQSEIGRRMDSGQMSGVNSGLKVDPVGTIKALRAALVPAPTTTPTPAAVPTSRTFPFQNRTVDGMIDRDTGDIVAFAKSIVGTPNERGSIPKYTIKVDEDVTIEAQSEKSLDNALQKISSGAPVRVFRNAGKGVTLDFNKPGPVTPAPAKPAPPAPPPPPPPPR